MKFINYLESITGIGVYPMVSLILFLSIFLIATFSVLKADKNLIQDIKNIPLEGNEQ